MCKRNRQAAKDLGATKALIVSGKSRHGNSLHWIFTKFLKDQAWKQQFFPEQAADQAIEAIRKLASDIGIPSGLKEFCANEEDLELLAEHAMQDVCRLTNPGELSKEEIIEIYRKAL